MSDQQVLYEAKLDRTGTWLAWGASMAMVLFLSFGLAASFLADSFSKIFPIVWSAICIGIFSWQIRRMLRLRRSPGVYRISIDDYGLYVQCDAPSFAPSFSVIAPDISCLVHKTIKDFDSGDEHEYFIETKSGARYKIEDLLLVKPPMRVSELFEEIIDRFSWVEILEEVESRPASARR